MAGTSNEFSSLYLVQKIPLTFQKKLSKPTKILFIFSRSTSIFLIFPPKINGNIGIKAEIQLTLLEYYLEGRKNTTDMSVEFTSKYKLGCKAT